MNAPTQKALYIRARKIAATGQPVFPCHSKGERAKRPLTKNGFKDASTDPDQIKAWWKAHPDAAIGIPTGIKWDVLDVDTKGAVDGRVHLDRLNRLGLLNGCQRLVHTPSGGWHLYFKTAPGLTNKARATLGLDVRALGGYVLAAGSYIETPEYSGSYDFAGDVNGTDEPLYWDLILQNLAPIDTDTKQEIELPEMDAAFSLGGLKHWLLNRRQGERNHGLFWCVMRCIENGVDPNELLEVALDIGLDEDEASLTINSAIQRAGFKVTDLKSEEELMFDAF